MYIYMCMCLLPTLYNFSLSISSLYPISFSVFHLPSPQFSLPFSHFLLSLVLFLWVNKTSWFTMTVTLFAIRFSSAMLVPVLMPHQRQPRLKTRPSERWEPLCQRVLMSWDRPSSEYCRAYVEWLVYLFLLNKLFIYLFLLFICLCVYLFVCWVHL